MKKIKNLLGIFLCLMFITSIGYSQQSSTKIPDKSKIIIDNELPSAFFADCNINAGGDITYCFDHDTISLYGTISGIDLGTISWDTISTPTGASVTILNPTNLITEFTSSPSYLPGDYVFVISGYCSTDSTFKQDTVVITVTPASSVSQIFDASGTLLGDTFQVCRNAVLVGLTPGSGETGYWSAGAGINFTTDGDTLFDGYSQSTSCLFRTYYYTISNGGCFSIDTIVVEYDRASLAPYINNRTECGDTLSICGSPLGCNATAAWTIIPPSGVAIPTSQVSANTQCLTINFTVGGLYQIVYNVTSTGLCPSGVDTADFFVCLSANSNLTSPLGPNELTRFCDTFPNDTIWLTTFFDPLFTYTNWTVTNGAGAPNPPTIVQTGIGQGYAIINDQSIDYYRFSMSVTGPVADSCTAPNGSILNCQITDVYRVAFQKAPAFIDDADTLNIFCQNPGEFFRPRDYINTTASANINVLSLQVPIGCSNIVVGQSYTQNSFLDFSCEGTYIFQNTISNFVDSSGTPCEDTMTWVVNVATLQNPSAGSDAYTSVCVTDTIPLVGSAPLDVFGNPNPFAITQWAQVDGFTPVTFLGSINDQILDVTGFVDVGTYMFEYSYSRDSNCYLADTMYVIVDSCDACPEFRLQTCCDLISNNFRSPSGALAMDPAIKSIIDKYQQDMKSRYRNSSIDCCSPCNNPTDSFPVFVTDTNNFLVDYNIHLITWSHDPSNNTNTAFLFPNQQTIVTVYGPDSCVWRDTFLLECCLDTIEIVPYCAWLPCDFPLLPVPLHVQDQDGNILDAGYSFNWSNGATTHNTSALISQMPIYVTVYDSATGCIYNDTFDLYCCYDTIEIVPYCEWIPCDFPNVPVPMHVQDQDGNVLNAGYSFNWSNGYTTHNSSALISQMPIIVTVYDSATRCTYTDTFDIDCPPDCTPIVPTNLTCNTKNGWQILNWTTTPGLTYEVEIIYNDPFCVKGGTGTNKYNFFVSGGSYTVNVSPITGCLSWRVRSICPDGTVSAWTAKQCCCITKPCLTKIPSNLRCSYIKGGHYLTWDNVPGATYELELYYGDPKCCKKQLGYITIPLPSNTNSYFVSNSSCFSWRVRSVCGSGKEATRSAWSSKSCSCYNTIIVLPDGGSRSSGTSGSNNGGIGANIEMKVKLSPNPAREYVTFQVNTPNVTSEIGKIEITSLTGAIVHTSSISLNGSTIVDLTELSGGTYLYRVISDGNFKSGRIVIID